eukprot:UN02656
MMYEEGERADCLGAGLDPVDEKMVCRATEPCDCPENQHVTRDGCKCDINGESPAEDDNCPEKEYCAADEYVDCGDTSCQCLPCPDGMTAEAETNQVNGDGAETTTCDENFCNNNQKVENNQCVDCESGTYNPCDDEYYR